MDWKSCMFCQQKKKEMLVGVTLKTSKKILDLSTNDQTILLRLSGISDLKAAGGKYHYSCLKRFERKAAKTNETTDHQKIDLAMQLLAAELKESANHAHVLQMSEVFNRYSQLAEKANITVPASFVSRRATFKEKVQEAVKDFFDFVVVPNEGVLLVPRKFKHLAFRDLGKENEDPSMTYQPPDSDFIEMVHVALKLRGEILAHPKHTGFVVGEEDMINCVPTRLFMFIRLMFGGQSLLEGGEEDSEDIDMNRKEADTQTRVLSIAQDLVYNVSGGKHWTPKHIGLASTLHQATRSKELVQLFHNAGHVISYHSLLQVDTAMAEKTLQTMDAETGAVTPPNFVHGRFTHFTCDNIDINDSSLDGKNSFHATQMAGWQRGPEKDMLMKDLKPSQKESLQVPDVMEEIFPAEVVEGKAPPASTENTRKEWFQTSDQNKSALKAAAQDMAFVLKRQDHAQGNTKEGWTSFNQSESVEAPEVTSVGYMPIIQAPAHDLDTLNTVVVRCKQIANNLGQHHVVITVDEALFCKLMELKWAKPEYQDFLIVRLGGLHTALKFMEVIGKHVQSSGLQEAWVEGNLLGPKTAEKVLAGKSYDKGMRAHKITFQAVWRILLPQFLNFMEDKNPDLKKELLEKSHNSTTEDLITTLLSAEFETVRDDFVKAHNNPNFKYWWGYLQMVQILLQFTRAQRDGLWDLHLHAFQCMLPYFMRYNQTNYARWGTIYLNEMHQLPDEVKQEFQAGNFVVKRSAHPFNQVSPDHAQEWLNGLGKKRGGIIGITKTTSALSRWALSYNLRSHLALETMISFGLGSGDNCIHNETTKGRKKVDLRDEDALLSVLQRFGLFSDDAPRTLQNIANKDLVTQEIEDDLLLAANKGQDQLDEFVEERLLPHEERKVAFRDTLPKNKYLTFSSLFEVQQLDSRSGKTATVKADRNILQRLIAAYEAGRQVNLNNILTHELFAVPLALAEVNGQLRTGSKAVLAEVLTADVPCPDHLDATDLGEDPVLIIDGQALIVAIGKPKMAKTFGDLADTFVETVLQSGAQFKRIDVVFDRYFETSIKSGTRERRGKNTVAIRRPVSSRDVPLPAKWENFMAHEGNKEDLARFLSHQLLLHAPADKVIVAAGGWSNPERVESSDPNLDVESLEGCHEEADTRTILHCVKTTATSIVVSARDTDILIMLISFFHEMACRKIWMKAGTAKKRKYIPVHAIVDNLQMTPETLNMLPGFHALTGSDTTSYLAGHSKKTCWEVFREHHNLLCGLGSSPELSEQIIKNAEEFVCKIYGAVTASSTNEVRVSMFVKGVTSDRLPPTSDALLYHIKRSHYQALVWRQAHLQHPALPSPETMGWKMEETVLVPELSSLPPVPKACVELISCSCSTGCRTKRCSCKKAKIPCIASCKCKMSGEVCRNV